MQAVGPTMTAANAANPATPQPRLVRAAHEFEAQMMKELLKPLTASGALTGDDSDSGAGSQSTLGEYASEALARSLSEHGGFGIANRIVRDLSQSGNKVVSGQVTGNLHRNTVMSTLK